MSELALIEKVRERIFVIRGKKVMLDFYLAKLYGVEAKQLKRTVRRNLTRFPCDFMFEIRQEEIENLRCQFGTSSWGGRRYKPFAFTEQGIAMLSSVLNSERAIQVNITIMRTFTRIKEMMVISKELASRINELERQVGKDSKEIQTIFKVIQQLISQPEKKKKPIGFNAVE